jgi:hypothetical protein
MTAVSKYITPTAAGAEVDACAERHMSAKGGTYQEAVHIVLTADAELARVYGMRSSRVTAKPLRPRPAPAPVQMSQGNPAGAEVDRRVQALIAEHPHLDYHEAMGAVLKEDPGLKNRYAGMTQ